MKGNSELGGVHLPEITLRIGRGRFTEFTAYLLRLKGPRLCTVISVSV